MTVALERPLLILIDILVLIGSFLFVGLPIFAQYTSIHLVDASASRIYLLTVFIAVAWFWLEEHYSTRSPFLDLLKDTIKIMLVMFILSAALLYITGFTGGRRIFFLTWGLNIFLLPFSRYLVRQTFYRLNILQLPAIIVGVGSNAHEAYHAITQETYLGYSVKSFVNFDDDPALHQLVIDHITFPVVPISHLEKEIERLGKPRIIFALESLANKKVEKQLQKLIVSNRNIHIVPSFRGLPLLGMKTSHFFNHEVLFLTVKNNLLKKTNLLIKRMFDIFGAIFILILLSPLMLWVSYKIRKEDGCPILFSQLRVAKANGEFKLLKFRSMVKDADEIMARWQQHNTEEWQRYNQNNFKLNNDPRVLKVGRWIRASSIDELPQLFNVLKGEMSLVGPRPLLARELHLYDAIEHYQQTRPGITGLWQISGRSTTTFADRANMDRWYVQNWSLWYDVAILFKTIMVVLKKHGAY